MMKLFRWNNIQKLGLLVVLGWQIPAFAVSDFQYFGSEIDYWREKNSKPAPEKATTSRSENPAEPSAAQQKFPWDKYMDPKNKEFFKEGDYTPPEPFIETVRNPTDANLKMWFAYIDKKNELTRKLQERMKEYLAKNSPQIETLGRDTMKAKLAALPTIEIDAKRYRFRMYFDSHCPHCRKMFETLSDLQSRGFYVEVKQVDSDPRGLDGLNIPSSRATPGEIQAKDIQSVPVLFIGDMKTKEVYRLTGYQSTATIFSTLEQTQAKPSS